MTQEQATRETAAPLTIIGAALVLLLAVGGLAIGWSTDFVGCLNDDVCEDRGLLRAQWLLAIVNVAVALVLMFTVVRRHRRASIGAALAFAFGFLVWAVLNDAATHGWDNLRLWPG